MKKDCWVNMAALRMLLFGQCTCSIFRFFKKTKLANQIICTCVVNRYIIFLLSYCEAFGVDYFLRKRLSNIAEIKRVFFQNG